MDSPFRWIVPLAEAADWDEREIGGKAAKLAQLARAGFRVPDGFSITTQAYEHFIESQDLARRMRIELGRKPFASLRWEEIWDVALRIRSAFLSTPMPQALAQAIESAVEDLGSSERLAVRSSAPGEDSASRSFAGLHESVTSVRGPDAVLDAVRIVWASLWSDAALLYRHELALDPRLSRMAVVVQRMVYEDYSGVAFGRDPRDASRNHAIIEAVPGSCGDLVDGVLDPDRWILDNSSGEVIEWRAGERRGAGQRSPILDSSDLRGLHQMLLGVESLFHWPPDTEWTGLKERFTLLQARPITTAIPEEDDQRSWYLTLRPSRRRLHALAQRVSRELIPELEDLGTRFSVEAIEKLDDQGLAAAIEERHAAVQQWRQIYMDDFIPFAHGVRQLGLYYNDVMQPEDPYEFVHLLKGQQMVASRRNAALQELAEMVRADEALLEALRRASELGRHHAWHAIQAIPGAEPFMHAFERLQYEFMDVAYAGERLVDHPELLLRTIHELARSPESSQPRPAAADTAPTSVQTLERRFFEAAGPEREEAAREVLAIGRLSWRLRDDDNVLLGRVESQLLRALDLAGDRLRAAGRLPEKARVSIAAAPVLIQALQHPSDSVAALPVPRVKQPTAPALNGESPRQLVGQPAAPGLATGLVRSVRDSEDLGRFRPGEVMVCEAIQPTMTHLVPLACAIVERRGGMLIHGAIIARELGIPCVNGISNAVDLLKDGEIVTVDGHLGIVTVGAPEFDLELA